MTAFVGRVILANTLKAIILLNRILGGIVIFGFQQKM
jgi:hypothetical protein